MIDPLMDSLDPAHWELVDAGQKGDGYKEYQVMRQHKPDGPNKYKYIIQMEDGDGKSVVITGCQKDKDPLKNIGSVELRLDEECNVTGIDIDGEVAVLKK